MRLLYAVFVVVLAVLSATLSIELTGQAFAALWPAYDVVFLEPHERLGWTLAPHLRFRWTGTAWYAVEFSVDVQVNSNGFRDFERFPEKPSETRRVALLGDSLIEALQVPFQKTAGQRLQALLDASTPGAADGPRRYEVLNFGVSNYGLGQYLLVWEEQARRFRPDHAFLVVADFHLVRTLRRYEFGAFPETQGRRLWVRPTFRLEGDRLVREPARDTEEFRRLQAELIRDHFGGERMRRFRPQWGSANTWIWTHLAAWARGTAPSWRPRGPAPRPRFAVQGSPPPLEASRAEILELNLRILGELGREMREAYTQPVILDLSRYFAPNSVDLETVLRDFCERERFGYLPVWQALVASNRDGRRTAWPHDGHFNELGNEILAEAMYTWLTERTASHAGR